jgi:hypothetical protein
MGLRADLGAALGAPSLPASLVGVLTQAGVSHSTTTLELRYTVEPAGFGATPQTHRGWESSWRVAVVASCSVGGLLLVLAALLTMLRKRRAKQGL